MINREILTDVIRQNIIRVVNEHPLLFNDYEFIVGDEEVIAKSGDIQKPKTIYIVISYGGGSYVYDFGEQGFTLNVISDMVAGQSVAKAYQDYSIAWQLLELYYHTFNLSTMKLDDTTIKQVYNTPTTLINFEEIGSGLRTLIAMSGSFNLSSKLLDIEKLQYVYDTYTQEVATLKINDDLVLPERNSNTYDTLIFIGGYSFNLSFNEDRTYVDTQIASLIYNQIKDLPNLPFTMELAGEYITFSFIKGGEQTQDYKINTMYDFQGNIEYDVDYNFTITKGTTKQNIVDIPYIQVIPTLKVALKPNVYPYIESDSNRPFSRSIPQHATLVLTINVLSNDSPFTRKIWGLLLKKENVIETSFKLNIYVDETLKLENEIFYLDNAPITKTIGETPSITITLTN